LKLPTLEGERQHEPLRFDDAAALRARALPRKGTRASRPPTPRPRRSSRIPRRREPAVRSPTTRRLRWRRCCPCEAIPHRGGVCPHRRAPSSPIRPCRHRNRAAARRHRDSHHPELRRRRTRSPDTSATTGMPSAFPRCCSHPRSSRYTLPAGPLRTSSRPARTRRCMWGTRTRFPCRSARWGTPRPSTMCCTARCRSGRRARPTSRCTGWPPTYMRRCTWPGRCRGCRPSRRRTPWRPG